MDMKLELVPVPVSDVDRAKAFYTEKLGFRLEVDREPDTFPESGALGQREGGRRWDCSQKKSSTDEAEANAARFAHEADSRS